MRDRETETERETESERDKESETERQRESEREKERETERKRETFIFIEDSTTNSMPMQSRSKATEGLCLNSYV